MDKAGTKACFVAIGLLGLTSIILAIQPPMSMSEDVGVASVLPDTLGPYTGIGIRYCQNEQCMVAFTLDMLDDAESCPECGGVLDTASLGERQILPADTLIIKKQYRSPIGESYVAAVVISGKSRRSIHRPQRCVVAQGFEIVQQRPIKVDLGPERKSMEVMLLDLNRKSADGQSQAAANAYFFAGEGRVTPYHVERLMLTAMDGILRNRFSRWAYISISTTRTSSSQRHVRGLKRFIAALHDEIVDSSGQGP